MAVRDPIEQLAPHALHGDGALRGQLQSVAQMAARLRPIGHHQFINLPPIGAQQLIHRVATVDRFSHSKG